MLGLEQLGDQFLGRAVRQVVSPVRVLEVEVVAVGFDGGHGDPPGILGLPPARAGLAAPPCLAVGELLESQRLGLRVVLPSFGDGDLVEPDLPGAAGLLEEHQVGGDRRVGSEHTGR